MAVVKNSYINWSGEDSAIESLLFFQSPLVQFPVPIVGNLLVTSGLGDLMPTLGLYGYLAHT